MRLNLDLPFEYKKIIQALTEVRSQFPNDASAKEPIRDFDPAICNVAGLKSIWAIARHAGNSQCGSAHENTVAETSFSPPSAVRN